jgi:hypothetical protein
VTRGLTVSLLAAALFVPAAFSLAAAQEEPEVQVLVDNPRPAADDVVRLTYAFSGPGVGGSLRAPAELPLTNLVVVGGPNTSTQISFINGQLSRSSSLTYFLRPAGPGPAEIGEATFRLGEKELKAGAYLLEVGTARRPPGAGPAAPAEEADPFGRRTLRPGPAAPAPSATFLPGSPSWSSSPGRAGRRPTSGRRSRSPTTW